MKNLMKKMLFLLPLLAAFSTANATAVTDVQDYTTTGGNSSGTTYFVDVDANKGSDPYYRWYNQDWDWTHGAIAGASFSSAILQISAFDVDNYPSSVGPELDVISVKNPTTNTWVTIGTLDGNNNIWAFTTFDLQAILGNPSWLVGAINSGLQVAIDIDSTHNIDEWAVTLGKSTLSVDGGGQNCVPTPGVPCTNVPEPESLALYGLGLAGLGLSLARRRKA